MSKFDFPRWKPFQSYKKVKEVYKMTEIEEDKKGTPPDYKGDGVAVWINETKEGKKYLSIKILNNKSVPAWKYEQKDK